MSMKPTKAEQAALSKAVGNAALDTCREILGTDKEAIRAAFWNSRKTGTRKVALMFAGLDLTRAEDALSRFSGPERVKIRDAARYIAQQMEIISKCMAGGEWPDSTGGDRSHKPHAVTGIAHSVSVPVTGKAVH